MEARKDRKRDWSSLPPEVLNFIAKKLEEIADFVRFRAVCPAWSSSTPITDVPAQFPWILENIDDCDEQNLRFYSIPANKHYNIQSAKRVIKMYGLTEGYLPFMENMQLSLMNPLSNHEIPLPPYYVDSSPGESPWSMSQINRIGKSVIACRYWGPGFESKIIFYNVGQEDGLVSNIGSLHGLCTSCYLKDMLFLVKHDGSATEVIDIMTGAIAYVIPPVKEPGRLMRVELVETSRDIFRFSMLFDRSSNKWRVHRLHVGENGSRCWVKATNVGNYAFFVDKKCGFILKANESATIKANSIYFLDKKYLNCGRYKCQVIGIDIETGAAELLPLPVNRPAGWFVPILHHH